MHRQEARSNLQIYTIDEDPRIKSKCSTPKKLSHQNNHTIEQKHSPHKDINKAKSNSVNRYNRSQERTMVKKRNIDLQAGETSKVQFEKQIEDKIEGYKVVAGTLREYLRDQQAKGIKKSKHLATVAQIIKAYTRSHITELSPGVTFLITKMIDTLPIGKKTTEKSKSSIKKQKSKICHPPFVEQARSDSKTLRTEIVQLEQDLIGLKQQCQLIEQMRQQYEQMSETDKQNYIIELEQIVIKQKQILDGLQKANKQ